MVWGTIAAIAAPAVISSIAQYQAAGQAADAQTGASKRAIEEQRRQFDAMQELLRPYVEAGTGAIGQQQALLGLSGPQAQQEAIQALQSSPQFQALTQQGETALLQNAAATGGVRGGNLAGALAQFRPQMLSQLIESQYGRLGGLAQLGQASAAGTGSAGLQTGSNISNLLGQIGQAQAGQSLAQGQAVGNVANTAGNIALLRSIGAF